MAFAMAVRASGHQKTKLTGQFQVMLTLVRGMLGMKAFQTIQSLRSQVLKRIVRSIESWMRHDSCSSRSMDQSNRVASVYFLFGDPGGSASLKKPIEGFVHAATKSS